MCCCGSCIQVIVELCLPLTGAHSKAACWGWWRAQQAVSGRMSARMAAVEQTQAEFRSQLSEVLLTSHNNEQALKACTNKLDNLATMVANIMNKLESMPIVSEPNPTVNNRDVHGGVPKSTCENQAQSRPTRIGTSMTLPIDVEDNTDDRFEDVTPPKDYTRLTRSKDAKLKGVTVSQDNSQVGSKGRASEKAPKKGRVAKGGVKKLATTAATTGQPISADEGRPEVGVVVGVVPEHGSISPKTTVDGSGVEDGGEGGNKASGTRGLVDVEDGIGEGVSGVDGSLEGGKGRLHRRESEHVEDGDGDVGVLVEAASLVESHGKVISPKSGSPKPPTMSPSKIGDTGGSHSAPAGQVSPPHTVRMSSIAEINNPTKLLIFNVHGTLLDTSLLNQPNPNCAIRVTKKTPTRRFVFRPWMMEFLGRCFKKFKIAFWGIKSSEYMSEVLREILPVFAHLDGHSPVFTWSAKECESFEKSEDVSMWVKPLTKVWKAWPCWDATNTVIIDHHEPRVECNPPSNVIIPPPFYVTNMKDLSEDKDYLKNMLWPALEGLYVHEDVGTFLSTYNVSKLQARVCEQTQISGNMADSMVQVPGGEGSCELEVHNAHCPPSF